uniref:Cupredoxin superfamily protein n=1 Tax=Sedum alfredii TaxID=439688 RepID=A0A8E4V0F6_9MAGN|nr:cupredoxin superfamily protein [Sedum alfredii]
MGKSVCSAVVLLSIAFLQLSVVCYGAVYFVGDKTGWTTLGNYDYKAWAATKNFQVGDVITFVYHSEIHNVLQVTEPEYTSCNVTKKPILSFATGNDSITLTTNGHHYFLCGVSGHCQKGQKVDVNVGANSHNGSAPSPSVNVTNPSTPVSPLSPNNGGKLSLGWFVRMVVPAGVVMFVG